MRHMALILLILTLPGCIFYSRWQESANNAEILEQKAALLRDHRQWLNENSRNPERQRDCSVYNQSRTQLDVTVKK